MLWFEGLTIHQIEKTGLFNSSGKNRLRDLIAVQDLVHLHGIWEPLLHQIARLASQYHVPYVVTPHGMLDPWPMAQKAVKKKIALLLSRRRMIEKADFVQVLTQDEESSLRALKFRTRCEVVPNGIDLERVDNFLDPRAFCKEHPNICKQPFVLFLGRLHFVKGLDVLAKAIPIFLRQFPDWRIVIAGPDGGAQNNFVKTIADYGISDKVHLLGPVYGEQKFSLLANSEVFCQPSRQEGFSVSILEALAASVPVVITPQCRFKEIEEQCCGVVSELNPVAIADALCALASSKNRKTMGRNGRKLIEQKYTWPQINAQLLKHYRSRGAQARPSR